MKRIAFYTLRTFAGLLCGALVLSLSACDRNDEPAEGPETPELDSPAIEFEDPTVFATLRPYVDKNGDKIITEKEAMALTYFKMDFFMYQPITSFDEFRYFTGVTTVARAAFACCNLLERITLPETFEEISWQMFEECTSLTAITIPASVTVIRDQSFFRCRKLSKIYCKPTTPPEITYEFDPAREWTFDEIADDARIYVPRASANAYREAWPQYADMIEEYDF